MSDIYEYDFRGKKLERNVCHVAYTLNNNQPVKSTIIGDQPLFYWDCDVEEEDDDYLNEAELGILESEIENLKQEIETLDRFSAGYAEDPDQKFEDFLDNVSSIVEAKSMNQPDIAALKNALFTTLGQSRIAEFYIGFAEDHNVEILMTRHVPDGEYDRKSGHIFINADLDHVDQVLVAARELRRHWQHRQGALINPLMFHPDNAVLINRIQVADLSVTMVRIAWELQLSGQKDVWERVENSSLGDLGRALAREAFLDFRTLNNGQASAAVFETWFLSERCRLEDKKLIKNMLADYQGYVFDLEEAEKSITPTLISALGEMPYGKNYLTQHAGTLMSDPIFTDVRDRSNANFLWFIKFERSFREAEQELQHDPEAQSKDIRPKASSNKQNQDYNNEETITFSGHAEYESMQRGADIVTLYSEHDQGSATDAQNSGDKEPANKSLLSSKHKDKRNKKKSQADQHKGNDTNVVYLRRWSGE